MKKNTQTKQAAKSAISNEVLADLFEINLTGFNERTLNKLRGYVVKMDSSLNDRDTFNRHFNEAVKYAKEARKKIKPIQLPIFTAIFCNDTTIYFRSANPAECVQARKKKKPFFLIEIDYEELNQEYRKNKAGKKSKYKDYNTAWKKSGAGVNPCDAISPELNKKIRECLKWDRSVEYFTSIYLLQSILIKHKVVSGDDYFEFGEYETSVISEEEGKKMLREYKIAA